MIKINKEILNRKGARKVQDIPNEVLDLLNKGAIETVNLTEWLAVDHLKLIKHNFSNLGISKEISQKVEGAIKAQKKASTMNTIKVVGATLFESFPNDKKRQTIINKLSNHPSDSIRCYAPYLISLNENLKIEEKLDQAKSLVADKHFGIREIVWMALRPAIEKDLKKSISFLKKWASDEDENVRRFTTESTRPRGVWCKHIDALKENPSIALPILNKLKSDPSKYVQNSVGNWLNDASKSQADFVIELCGKWQKVSPTKETAKIIKRAKRTIDKK